MSRERTVTRNGFGQVKSCTEQTDKQSNKVATPKAVKAKADTVGIKGYQVPNSPLRNDSKI